MMTIDAESRVNIHASRTNTLYFMLVVAVVWVVVVVVEIECSSLCLGLLAFSIRDLLTFSSLGVIHPLSGS